MAEASTNILYFYKKTTNNSCRQNEIFTQIERLRNIVYIMADSSKKEWKSKTGLF